jgi:hypothetical protein
LNKPPGTFEPLAFVLGCVALVGCLGHSGLPSRYRMRDRGGEAFVIIGRAGVHIVQRRPEPFVGFDVRALQTLLFVNRRHRYLGVPHAKDFCVINGTDAV